MRSKEIGWSIKENLLYEILKVLNRLTGIMSSISGGGGGSGTVLSVTGAYIDNTDPANPVSKARVTTQTTNSSVTPNVDTMDAYEFSGLGSGLAIQNPTGTPINLQSLIFKIKDNGTSRNITYGTDFSGNGSILPSSTVVGQTLFVPFIWDSSQASWLYIGGTNVNRTMLNKTVDQVPLTGTTAITKMYSVLVPGNTIKAGDFLRIVGCFSKSGVAASQGNRIYFNTTDQVAGATLIAVVSQATTNTFGKVVREIMFKTQASQWVLDNNANFGSDEIASYTNFDTFTHNFANDQYIIFACNLNNGADTALFEGGYIEIIR